MHPIFLPSWRRTANHPSHKDAVDQVFHRTCISRAQLPTDCAALAARSRRSRKASFGIESADAFGSKWARTSGFRVSSTCISLEFQGHVRRRSVFPTFFIPPGDLLNKPSIAQRAFDVFQRNDPHLLRVSEKIGNLGYADCLPAPPNQHVSFMA